MKTWEIILIITNIVAITILCAVLYELTVAVNQMRNEGIKIGVGLS